MLPTCSQHDALPIWNQPGLRREGQPAWPRDGGTERAVVAGGDAIWGRTDQDRLADGDQDHGPRPAVARRPCLCPLTSGTPASTRAQAMGTMLEVRELTKRFGGFTAVDRIDFDLAEGEILGLIGPNGSGKSTTFNLVAGALAPSGGSIRLDGREKIGRAHG